MRVDGRSLAVTVVAVIAAAATLGACGGGGSGAANAPHPAAYLTIVHSPLNGALAARDDATLLALGQRACGDMDNGMRSDQVVADLGGDPSPAPPTSTATRWSPPPRPASSAPRTAPPSKPPLTH